MRNLPAWITVGVLAVVSAFMAGGTYWP